MNSTKLLRFSSVMFFAAATILLLTAFTQVESRTLYALLGSGAIVLGIVMSAFSKRVK